METATIDLLSRALDAYQMRTKALSSNIANLDTPDYQRLSISFEDQLREASHSIDSPERLRKIRGRVEVQNREPVLEDELMELSDTQMRQQLSTRALRDQFSLMKTSITGRPSAS